MGNRLDIVEEPIAETRVIRAKVSTVDQSDIDQLTAFCNSTETPNHEQLLKQLREISGILAVVSETTNVLTQVLAKIGETGTLRAEPKKR